VGFVVTYAQRTGNDLTSHFCRIVKLHEREPLLSRRGPITTHNTKPQIQNRCHCQAINTHTSHTSLDTQTISSMPQTNKLTADSWHDSLPFAMPQRHRNHHRNHSNNNPKRFSMSDSTIYKRNEARLLQNQPSINDDPRPKAIRILSLLPGLNMIVPPYDPQLHGTRGGGGAAKNETPPPQELFDHALFPDANIMLFGGAARSDSGNNAQRNHGLSLMPSIAITGIAAASAQVLFHRGGGPVAPTSSPFARTTNSTMMTSQSPSCYHHHSSAASSPTASISLTSTGDLNLTKHRVAATTSGAAPSTTMTVSTPQRPARVTAAARFQKNIPQHHIPSILQAASGLALPFVVREQLGGGGMAANVLAAFCSGCVQTYVPLLFQPAAAATTMTTTTLSSLRTVITSPPLFSSLSSPLLLGTHMVLAVTSLTLYDAAAPHGIVASTVAGATAGTIMAVVRQQPPSSVPRSALRHGTFFAIYRSLYHTVLPPPNDCYMDIHAT
jgi:hypothetical protein